MREAAPDLELAFRNDFERWTCPPAELDARVLELREAWGDMHSDEESVEVDEDDDEDLYEWEPEPIIPGEGGNEYGDY